MRNIINMIIKIAIIWGAAWMFPEYVKIQDTRTMVLVVATLLIASIVLAVIMMGVLILAALPGNADNDHHGISIWNNTADGSSAFCTGIRDTRKTHIHHFGVTDGRIFD